MRLARLVAIAMALGALGAVGCGGSQLPAEYAIPTDLSFDVCIAAMDEKDSAKNETPAHLVFDELQACGSDVVQVVTILAAKVVSDAVKGKLDPAAANRKIIGIYEAVHVTPPPPLVLPAAAPATPPVVLPEPERKAYSP